MERLGDEAGTADSLVELGKLLEGSGQYEAAEQCFDKALDINHRQNNPVKMGIAFNSRGVLYEQQGDEVAVTLQKAYYHKALEKLEQALILFKQYTYHDVAITERNIARVKEKLGEG